MKKEPLKKFPKHKTDKAAGKFVEETDLSEYDFSEFKPVQFEILKKSARLELRLSQEQLASVKVAAKKLGMPYTRLVRQFIDQGMQALEPGGKH